MILEFRTATDINGNSHNVQINTDKREYNTNRITHRDMIKISLKDYRAIISKLKADGYNEVE